VLEPSLPPVLQVVHRAITRFLHDQAGLKAEEAHSGAVTLIQRFGSAANLNIHLRCLVLDGVYRLGTAGTPEFVEVPAPTDEALQAVLHKIITRTMKLLTRRGLLIEEQGQAYLADTDGDSDEARSLRPLQAALVPRPRLHPIRFHSVLAPTAKLRAMVVPQPVERRRRELGAVLAHQRRRAVPRVDGHGAGRHARRPQAALDHRRPARSRTPVLRHVERRRARVN